VRKIKKSTKLYKDQTMKQMSWRCKLKIKMVMKSCATLKNLMCFYIKHRQSNGKKNMIFLIMKKVILRKLLSKINKKLLRLSYTIFFSILVFPSRPFPFN